MSEWTQVRRAAAACMAAVLVSGGCGSGEPPQLGPEIVLDRGEVSNPTTAVDGTGAYLVAWVASRGGQADVYLSRSADGAHFSEPIRVNDLTGDAAPHEQAPAQIAAGPDGHVYVLWQNNSPAEGRRFPWSDLRLARSTDGGRTFEPAITVNDDAGGPPSSHTFHDIAVAANGTVFVSWIDSRVRSRAEAEAGSHADAAHAGASPGGMAAMHDPALPGPEIRLAWSADGGRTFGESVVVASEACPCCRTSLAIGRDGAVYVAWRAVEQGVRDIVVARSSDGGRTFTAPVVVHADGWRIDGCPHAGPSLAVDSAGALHVAWYTGADGRAGIHHTRSVDGGRTFEPPTPILTGDWVPVSQARLVATGGGVWIAWEDRRAEVPRIRLAALNAGELSARHPDSAAAGTSPALAAMRGRQAVAWLHDGGVRFQMGRATN